jgi:hypothetical protein
MGNTRPKNITDRMMLKSALRERTASVEKARTTVSQFDILLVNPTHRPERFK